MDKAEFRFWIAMSVAFLCLCVGLSTCSYVSKMPTPTKERNQHDSEE